MATRLPTTGNCRYSASTYGVARAAASAAALSASSPSARGVGSTTAAGARYGALYSRFVRNVAINTTAPNITRPVMGPSTNSSLRFFTACRSLNARGLARRPVRRSLGGGGSLSGGGRARRAFRPGALELSHVGNDGPPVCRRNRPAVGWHQAYPVRDDVKELPVRVLHDLLLVEG